MIFDVKNIQNKADKNLLIFWFFIATSWDVFQYFFLHFSGAWLIHYVLGGILFLNYYFDYRKNNIFIEHIKSKSFFFLVLWVIYVSINSYVKGGEDFGTVISYCYLAIYYALVLFCFYVDWEKTMRLALLAFLTNIIISFFVSVFTVGLLQRIEGTYVNANDFASYCIFALVVNIVLYYFHKISLYIYLFLLSSLFFLLCLSQSRTSFVCFIIVFIGFFILYAGTNINFLNLIFWGIFGIIILCSLYYIITNIGIGVRFAHIQEESTMSDYDNIITRTIEKFAGERSYYYFTGWDIFQENLWTGIGVENFRWHPYNYLGTVCHPEIMKQLCEEGILGMLLILSFFVSLCSRLIYSLLKRKHVFLLFLLFLLLFCLFYSFSSHMFPKTRFFFLFAMMSFIVEQKDINTLILK